MAIILPFLKRGGRRFKTTFISIIVISTSFIVLVNLCYALNAEINYLSTDINDQKNKEYLDPLRVSTCNNNGSNTFLLLSVPSSTGNSKQRLAIRNSWGSVVRDDDSLHLAFFIGRPENANMRRAIEEEKQLFNDIIELNVEDKYENLAKKSIGMLEWANSRCNHAKYMLKVDDDIFLNINLLIAELKVKNYRNSIIGCKVKNTSPFRFPFSKWYISRAQYSADKFPDYISGPAYVLSGDIIFKLSSATKVLPYIYLEDVYLTGICREYISAKVVGHPGFSCGFRDEGPCGSFFRYKITGHHYFPNEIERMWDELNDRWFTCPFKHSYVVSKFVDTLLFVV